MSKASPKLNKPCIQVGFIGSLLLGVDVFIDIVSKNGCMLLNVAPKADGSFPEEQKNVMLGIENWLKINGEAIYNIQP
jgi:alpha-L-fucosidase